MEQGVQPLVVPNKAEKQQRGGVCEAELRPGVGAVWRLAVSQGVGRVGLVVYRPGARQCLQRALLAACMDDPGIAAAQHSPGQQPGEALLLVPHRVVHQKDDARSGAAPAQEQQQ